MSILQNSCLIIVTVFFYFTIISFCRSPGQTGVLPTARHFILSCHLVTDDCLSPFAMNSSKSPAITIMAHYELFDS